MESGKLQELAVDALRIPVYNGIGTFSEDGHVVYHISLPACAKKEITGYDILDLRDTIFVRIITTPPREVRYLNPDNDVVRLNFTIPKFEHNQRRNIALYLWHDNTLIGDETGARAAMANCIAASLEDASDTGIPKKCGKGILTFDS